MILARALHSPGPLPGLVSVSFFMAGIVVVVVAAVELVPGVFNVVLPLAIILRTLLAENNKAIKGHIH